MESTAPRNGVRPVILEEMSKHRSTEGDFDITDYTIEGMDDAIKRISSSESSILFWNIISQVPIEDRHTSGKLGFYHYKYKTSTFESALLESLKEHEWIFINNKALKPSQVGLEEFIDSGYSHNETLCNFLDIKRKKLNLKEVGASEEQIKNEMMGEYLRSKGISSEEEINELIELKNRLAKKHPKKDDFIERFEQVRIPLRNIGERTFEDVSKPKDSFSLLDDEDKISQELKNAEDKLNIEKERFERQAELKRKINKSEKYSAEWFDSLLHLEYSHSKTADNSKNKKAISISFGNVMKSLITILR